MDGGVTLIITIDGGGGVGKSAVAHELAKKLNAIHIPVGLWFRALAWSKINHVDFFSDKMLFYPGKKEAYPKFYWNKKDITDELYGNQTVAMQATLISSKSDIETMVFNKALEYAEGNIIVEGRNTCEFVSGEHCFHLYLEASAEERALRQLAEQKVLNECLKEEVISTLEKRYLHDISREVGRLKLHDSNILLNTTYNSLDQTVEQIYSYVLYNQKKFIITDNQSLDKEILQEGLYFFAEKDYEPKIIQKHTFIHNHNIGCITESNDVIGISFYLLKRYLSNMYGNIRKTLTQLKEREDIFWIRIDDETEYSKSELLNAAFDIRR